MSAFPAWSEPDQGRRCCRLTFGVLACTAGLHWVTVCSSSSNTQSEAARRRGPPPGSPPRCPEALALRPVASGMVSGLPVPTVWPLSCLSCSLCTRRRPLPDCAPGRVTALPLRFLKLIRDQSLDQLTVPGATTTRSHDSSLKQSDSTFWLNRVPLS